MVKDTALLTLVFHFLDHMLHQPASHGLIDLEVQATGDLQIDDHHTNEDVGSLWGKALGKHWARAKVLSALVISSLPWMKP